MIGIYKITNKINGTCYIGQSIHIEKRWRDEKRVAFNPKAHEYNYPLSLAFRKYGVDNFIFEVIEECSQDKLNEREKYWIHFYDSYNNGYNQTPGGDSGTLGQKKEITIGIINDLKTTDLYHKEIAKKWGVSVETVQGINTGRYWFSEYEEYPLQKAHKTHVTHGVESKIWKCKDCGKIISKGAERCIDCYSKFQRVAKRPSKEELYQHLIELKGNFTQAGKDYNVSDNAVRKWCDSYDLPRLSSAYKPAKEENPKAGATKPKQVAQIDPKTGRQIVVFNSLGDAARAVNRPDGSGHISGVCKGSRKTAYGYIWKYV